MKEQCSSCNTPQYLVNRTKKLCYRCNHFRIHGESVEETQNRQQREWRLRSEEKQKNKAPTPPKIYTIKQTTSKTAKKDSELSKLKFSISEEALMDGTYYCKGCGHSGQGLDRSHILSEKQRPDLALEEENIDLLCRECHMKWESWNIIKMLSLICFEKYLKYIYGKDKETFYKIFIKVEIVACQDIEAEEDLYDKACSVVECYSL